MTTTVALVDQGKVLTFAQYAVTVLELGLGNYEAALTSARGVYEDDAPYLGTHVLPDLVEAAVRSGASEVATAALARLSERARASATAHGVCACRSVRHPCSRVSTRFAANA